jgi:Meiotically Up-regulated Gene 113 (MUG113) protein
MSVYLIGDEHNRVKIGFSANVEKTRRLLQRGNADRLKVLQIIDNQLDFALERWLHEKFRKHRIPDDGLSGRREWFHWVDRMMGFNIPDQEVLERLAGRTLWFIREARLGRGPFTLEELKLSAEDFE